MRLHAALALHIIAVCLALQPSIAAACSFEPYAFYAQGDAPGCVFFHETSSYSGPYQIRIENRCEDDIQVRCEEPVCVDLMLPPGGSGDLPYTDDGRVAGEGVQVFWQVGDAEERSGLLRLGPTSNPCDDESLLCTKTPGRRSGSSAGAVLLLAYAIRRFRTPRSG
jgi:hypothetical protein